MDASPAEGEAGAVVLDAYVDAGAVMHPEDASPGGPHCGASPAAYGVFAAPDACPYELADGGGAGQGSFACGGGTCDSTTQYCQTTEICHVTPPDAGKPYVCRSLPSECVGSSDCSCIGNATGQNFAVLSDDGGCVVEIAFECN